MIVVKSISHEQRRAASITRAQARKQGQIHLKRITPGAQAAHVITASNYFALPTKEGARTLGIVDHVAFRTSRYMHREATGERVLHVCHRNFLTTTLEAQQTEMMALMARSPGSADAFEHMMLSVRNDVDLTPELMTYLPGRLLEILGAGEHQALVVWHDDTHYRHCHIGANRVHPLTLERLQLGDGWLLDMIAQAIALMEYEQGWSHEPNARYVADERGIRARLSNVYVRDAAGMPTGEHLDHAEQRESDARIGKLKLSNKAREHEERQGSWSDERTSRVIAGPIIRKARSWPELHERLAAEGMRYEKEGSGARLYMGDRGMPATAAHWSASIAKLERLGPFQLRDRGVQVAPFTPRRLDDADRRALYGDLKKERQAAAGRDRRIAGQTTREAITALAGEHARLRQLIDDRDWTGRGSELNLARQLASAAHRDAQTLLEANARMLMADATRRHRLPSFDDWSEDPESVDGYDDEAGRGPVGLLVGAAGRHVAPAIAFQGYDTEDDVWERRYSRNGDLKFIDRGNIIVVLALRERDEVRAALKLAHRKWGIVQVTGDQRFLHLVADLAAEEGVTLANAELQKRIAWRVRVLKQQADRREKAMTAVRERAQMMIEQWPYVREQDEVYVVAPGMMEQYGLEAQDLASPPMQKLLAAQFERQKPALTELTRDVRRDPGRFRTADDVARWTTPVAPAHVAQRWAQDEVFLRRMHQAVEKAERSRQESMTNANVGTASGSVIEKQRGLVASTTGDRHLRRVAAELRADRMAEWDKHIRLDRPGPIEKDRPATSQALQVNGDRALRRDDESASAAAIRFRTGVGLADPGRSP